MRIPKGKSWRVLLVVAPLLLIGVSIAGRRIASGMTAPFVRGSIGMGNFIALLWENIFHSGRIEELQDCEKRLRELEVRIDELDGVKEENRQLRAMLKLPEVRNWNAIRGELMMRDPAVWNWGFRIGIGEADGVIEGAPVLFGPSLAGRVSRVFRHAAEVETLANPTCGVSVFVFSGDNVYVGILRGNGQPSGGIPSAVVDFLPKHAVIQEGASIATSGLGVELPGGLPVGVVCGSPRLVDDARMSAPVALNADLRWMRFVSVLARSTE